MDVSILNDDGAGGNRKTAVSLDNYGLCPCTAVVHCESETTMVKRADAPEIFRCRKWAKEPGAEVDHPAEDFPDGPVNQPMDGTQPGLPTYPPEPVPTSTDVPVATGAPAVEDGSIVAAPGPVDELMDGDPVAEEYAPPVAEASAGEDPSE
jgi:hypothetical protein